MIWCNLVVVGNLGITMIWCKLIVVGHFPVFILALEVKHLWQRLQQENKLSATYTGKGHACMHPITFFLHKSSATF